MANNPHFSGGQPPPNHLSASMDPSHTFVPPAPAPFLPMMVPSQQSQQFMPVASSNYQPVGRSSTMMNPGIPSQHPQLPFPQQIHHLPSRPGQPALGPPPSQPALGPPPSQPALGPPPSQPPAGSISSTAPNVIIPSGTSIPPPNIHPHPPFISALTGPRAPLSSTYPYTTASYGQPPSFNVTPNYQPVPQMHPPSLPPEEHAGMLSEKQKLPVIPPQQICEQTESSQQQLNLQMPVDTNDSQLKPIEDTKSDWKEHVSATGRRYYYNKKTKISSWEKPLELMTPIERADATTDWKEFSSPDGQKYYYNKVTNKSKWAIPEELKLAREKASAVHQSSEGIKKTSQTTLPSNNGSMSVDSEIMNQKTVPPALDSVDNADSLKLLDPSNSVAASTALPEVHVTREPSVSTSGSDQVITVTEESRGVDKEIARKGNVTGEKGQSTSLIGQLVGQELLNYPDKQEAKNAFKALLESASVGSDWTWEQTMRAIINDQRYGALKTLAERKQAFNEFLGQRKKQEVEEKRVKHKKAREEFRKLLEESELTSSTRWSKTVAAIENDARFKALERERDRRYLFDEYLKELGEKERAKAQEERKQNVLAYRQFLESCDFIKPSTQWRKVQDRLEADERCSRLEKIDRLNIFQDYLRDLEKEEEEQKKIQKEEQRKIERKNRDDFRKLLEADVTSGNLNAKTNWRDYYTKVKDSAIYLAVASNTSGSTPKDLFEDVLEDLQKKYHDDKVRVKDAIKLKKFALTSISTLDQLKDAIAEEISAIPLSNMNFKIIFDELVERAKEKEGKEMKKRKHISDDFLSLLASIKEITASSKWDDSKILVEGSREFSLVGDENLCRDLFEEHLANLKEHAKEAERRRKDEKLSKEKDRDERERRKLKQKRDKDRNHDKETEFVRIDDTDEADIDLLEDSKKRSSDNSIKKHRKRPENSFDDFNTEGYRSKIPHKHHSGQKKSRRYSSNYDSDDESKHKRQRRDYRNEDDEDLEDGEFGAEGEI